MIFFEKFHVRWSDLDANMHLANAAYMNFCSQTRMSFLNQHHIGMKELAKWNMGPVVLQENFNFYKEFFGNQTVYVSLQLIGASEDGNIFQIKHVLYNDKGEACAQAEIFGVWIDLKLRKRTLPTEELIAAFNQVKDNSLKILTSEDIKNLTEKPSSVHPEIFNS